MTSAPDAAESKPSSAPPAIAAVAAAAAPLKPRLRGWLHAGMFPAVLLSGVILTALADSPRGRLACAIYTLTACLLFGVSALYHRGNWGPRADGVLQPARPREHLPDNRGDLYAADDAAHARVPRPGAALGGLGGRARRHRVPGLLGRRPRWLYTPCYIAMGWAAVFFLPDFLRTGGVAVLVLVIVGGLLYSAGGVIYGMKRPNPSPKWFGFHEVFHSFTLAAFVVHYVGISLVAYSHA